MDVSDTSTPSHPQGPGRHITRQVIGAAVVALLLGTGIGVGIGRSTVSPQPSGSADSAPTTSVSASASEDPTAQSTDYLAWKVSEYVADAARECSFSKGYLSVVISITNVSDRTILAGEASVSITDLFDKELISLDTPIDFRLKPGQTVNIGSTGDSCYSLNEFDADESRLAGMEDAKSMTHLAFEVTKLAFSDGSRLEF